MRKGLYAWLAAMDDALACLVSSVANPKFATSGCGTGSEFRIRSHTRKILYLVWYSDLKFLNADAIKMLGTSNPPL